MFTKLAVDPLTASAIEMAASSPEGTIRPYSRSLRVSRSPTCNFALLPLCICTSMNESCWIVTILFRSAAWMAMRAVMIFVVLAIGTGLSPFRSSRIRLVSLSSMMAALAVIAGGFPLAGGIGGGFCGGVGVVDVNDGGIVELPWLDV